MALSRPLAASDLQFKCRGLDQKLKIQMAKLSNDATVLSKILPKCISTYQSNIVNHGQRILLARSLSDVDLPGLSNIVDVAINDITSRHSTVLNLQTDIQALVEPCRGKRMECEDESIEKLLEMLQTIMRLILNQQEESRRNHELMVEDLNAQISDHNERVCTSERNRTIGAGAVGAIASITIGVLFAPATGGASLTIAYGAAAGNALGSGTVAKSINDKKGEYEAKAREHRRKASELRDEIEQSHKQMKEFEQTLSSLQTRIVELLEARDVLKSWVDKLLQADEVASNVQRILQELQNALTEAALQTDSSTIFQGDFAESPAITARRDICLDNIKKALRDVQRMLQSSEQKLM